MENQSRRLTAYLPLLLPLAPQIKGGKQWLRAMSGTILIILIDKILSQPIYHSDHFQQLTADMPPNLNAEVKRLCFAL